MRKRVRKEGKMGRAPCCVKGEVKKGAWTPEEDKILVDYITKNGHGTWRSLPKLAGLQRCGKSCRLRWTNYLRPDIKRGTFSVEEEQTIFQLHSLMGNKWAAIASRLPGRTDNEIKNFWNSHLRKRIPNKGLDLQAFSPSVSMEDTKSKLASTCHTEEWESARADSEARLSVDPLFPTTSTGVSGCDYFLRMWNSGVGDAFQKIKDSDTVICSSPNRQASSLIKVEPGYTIMMQAEPTVAVTSTSASGDQNFKVHVACKKEAEEMANASGSPDSCETEKSSDITMDLLLDFPNDCEYLEYLQGESNDNSAAFPPN